MELLPGGAIDGATLAFVLDEVEHEVHRAHAKHRESSVLENPAQRLPALVEEVGEVSKELTYDGATAGGLRKELIQVACVAVSWVYALDKETDAG